MSSWVPGYDPLTSLFGLEYDGVSDKSTTLSDFSLDVENFTIGVHISPSVRAYTFPIIHKTVDLGNPTNPNDSQWFVYSWQGFVYFLVHGTVESLLIKTLLPVCRTANLVHIVCTYSSTTKEPRIFINGIPALTTIVTALPTDHPVLDTTLAVSTAAFDGLNSNIGCDIVFGEGAPFTNSDVTEWHSRFYKGRAMSDSEVYALYQSIEPVQDTATDIVFSSDILGDSLYRLFTCDTLGNDIQLLDDTYNPFEAVWQGDSVVFSTIRASSFAGDPSTNRTGFNGIKKQAPSSLTQVVTHPGSPWNQSTPTHRATIAGSNIYYTKQETESAKETNLFKKDTTETRISNFNFNPTVVGVTYDGIFYSTVDNSETWAVFVSYQDNTVAATPFNKNVVCSMYQIPLSGFITTSSDVWVVSASNDISSYDNIDTYRPVFSTDSTKLSYSKKVSGYFQVFVQDITAYTFSSTNPTTGADLYTFDNAPVQLTSGSYNSFIAGWSPDDTKLLINVDENTNAQLCTINSSDGLDKVYLTDSSYNSWYGDWK